nr:HNH endonuclease [Streptomyces sp. YPW6]
MPQWLDSDRKGRLPKDWDRIRNRVLRRDGHQCTARDQYGKRCDELATDVDHIIAGDDHREANLRALCGWHHQRKSSREGAAASVKKRRQIGKRFQRNEAHPGLL